MAPRKYEEHAKVGSELWWTKTSFDTFILIPGVNSSSLAKRARTTPGNVEDYGSLFSLCFGHRNQMSLACPAGSKKKGIDSRSDVGAGEEEDTPGGEGGVGSARWSLGPREWTRRPSRTAG